MIKMPTHCKPNCYKHCDHYHQTHKPIVDFDYGYTFGEPVRTNANKLPIVIMGGNVDSIIDEFDNRLTAEGIYYAIEHPVCMTRKMLVETIDSAINFYIRPPAGLRRGMLYNRTSQWPSNFKWTWSHEDRDKLYIKGINPIRYMPAMGLVLWGDQFITAVGRIAEICDLASHHRPRQEWLNPQFIELAQLYGAIK